MSYSEGAVSRLKIRQVKSGLGAPGKIRRTLEALGLRHQRTVVKPDNAAIRGMVFRVKHLVEVESVSGEAEKGA
jgi:large subunit ribosomal protein L30